jgi:hypothetical protein
MEIIDEYEIEDNGLLLIVTEFSDGTQIIIEK